MTLSHGSLFAGLLEEGMGRMSIAQLDLVGLERAL